MSFKPFHVLSLIAATLLLFGCSSRDDDVVIRPDATDDVQLDRPGDITPDPGADPVADQEPEGFTIHDIQNPDSDEHPNDGDTVTVTGVVTAIDTGGSTTGDFFIQHPAGGPWSGIFVYNPGGDTIDTTSLQVGQTVELSGTYTEYFGLSEIQASSMTVTDATINPLEPETVNPADVATSGSLAEQYEGVLVQVLDVTVTELMDHGIFEVTGGLEIDDDLYYYPTPTVDSTFDRLAGVLTFTFDTVKLIPRNAEDMEGEGVEPTELEISDIQDEGSDSHPAEGSQVTVQGVVTAIDAYQYEDNPTTVNHFWIQEPAGGAYSGILVYNQYSGGAHAVDITGLEVGDTVEVSGEYDEYYDLSEIYPTALTILDNTTSAPAPAIVDPAQVATGGAAAEEYEGVLVTVQSVTVTTPDDDEDLRQYGTVAVTGGLEIDDELYAIDPLPAMNTSYSSITGVLSFTYGTVKLYPRSAADVVE